MLTQSTLDTLRHLKLYGMLQALDEQAASSAAAGLAFEERFGLIVDRERLHRDNGKRTRLLRHARLKHGQACLEDVDYRAGRGLDKRQILALASGEWLTKGQNLLICGPTGAGKTWLACAFAQLACRHGRSAFYWRVPRLGEELKIAHGDGSYVTLLKRLARTDLLVLDDWGLTPMSATERADLLEIIDDRVGARSTIVASQLPVDQWHAYLGEPTLADAILDRLVHHSHRIELKGESMRKRPVTLTDRERIK